MTFLADRGLGGAFGCLAVLVGVGLGWAGVAGGAEGPCGLPPTFEDGASYSRTIHVAPSPVGNDTTGDGSQQKPYATISKAASVATPGTQILVHAGTYNNSNFITNLQGTAVAPILITGAPGEGPAVIDRTYTGAEAIHLVDARYVVLANLTIRRATDNGINIDDGGSYATPSEHLVLRNVAVENVGTGGNNDGIKLSGVDYIRIVDCSIVGTNAGSGIDMVGCHYSEIAFSLFQDGGSNGTQTKGGTDDILIYGNLFVNAGDRAIQMGGSTGDAFFRPIDAPYEGRNIRAIANAVVGSEAAVAYVSAVDCLAANNTIYTPTNWVIRILNEKVDRLWPQNGRFFNNIVVFNHAQVTTFVNIGSNTLPATFSFSNDLWYALDDPGFSGPSLPTPETNPIIQLDPQFVDGANGDFHLLPTSPAWGAGVAVAEVSGDRDANCYGVPPTVGAYELVLLMGSEPPADGTLPKVQNNVILLTFDGPIGLPAGPALEIVPLGGGPDVGGSFQYGVQPDGVTLKAKEQGAVLANRTWYRVTRAAGFHVADFLLDVCTLWGDGDGSGQVLAQDYFVVKNHLFELTDARSDLDGSGQVLAQDYFVVKNHLFDAKPPKP